MQQVPLTPNMGATEVIIDQNMYSMPYGISSSPVREKTQGFRLLACHFSQREEKKSLFLGFYSVLRILCSRLWNILSSIFPFKMEIRHPSKLSCLKSQRVTTHSRCNLIIILSLYCWRWQKRFYLSDFFFQSLYSWIFAFLPYSSQLWN